jgi:hypothetical protein
LDNGKKNGKTREGLWECCRTEIENICHELSHCSEKLKNIVKSKDIEALLSHIILLEKTDDTKNDKLNSSGERQKLDHWIRCKFYILWYFFVLGNE